MGELPPAKSRYSPRYCNCLMPSACAVAGSSPAGTRRARRWPCASRYVWPEIRLQLPDSAKWPHAPYLPRHCAGIADHHTARIKHLCRLIRVREAGQTHRIAIHNEIHAAETRQYIRIRWLMGSVYRHTTYRNVWIQGRSGILAHPCGRVRLLLDRWVITSVTGREQCSGIHVAVFGVQLVGIDSVVSLSFDHRLTSSVYTG